MSKMKILGLIEDLLINALKALKDEDYQRRVWFRGEGPEVDSYTDTTMHFLSRCESIFQYSESLEYLGNENYQALKKLYDLVDGHVDLIEDRIDPDLLEEDELLNDPNWHDIQTLAEEVEEELKEFVKRYEND